MAAAAARAKAPSVMMVLQARVARLKTMVLRLRVAQLMKKKVRLWKEVQVMVRKRLGRRVSEKNRGIFFLSRVKTLKIYMFGFMIGCFLVEERVECWNVYFCVLIFSGF